MDRELQALCVCFEEPGATSAVTFVERTLAPLGSQQLLLQTMATALNRADLLQLEGRYQPEPGESPVPGVEVSGVVIACGSEVTAYRSGDRVYGVVPGGGFSSHCLIDQGMAMAVPQSWSHLQAAAMAEAGLTADTALFSVGRLQPGQTVLIHAAASGVGSIAIQMARLADAKTVCTTLRRQSGGPQGGRNTGEQCVQHLPAERVKILKGWFKDTLPMLPTGAQFALVHIDSDFYLSAVEILDYLFDKECFADGCQVFFDDWNCNRASNELGERRAWKECVERYQPLFSDCGDYGPLGHKFIIHKR